MKKNSIIWIDIIKFRNEYKIYSAPVKLEEIFNCSEELPFLGNTENEILTNIESLLKDEELAKAFESDSSQPLYDCEPFFDSIRAEFNLGEDEEIETYCFDDIDLPEDEDFDIVETGGFINGISI